MPIIGPFNNVPTGAVFVLQSTGVNGDIVLGPLNWAASGIATGLIPSGMMPSGYGGGNGSMLRIILLMGG